MGIEAGINYDIVALSEEHYDQWLQIYKEYLNFVQVDATDLQIQNAWQFMLGTYKLQGCLVAMYEGKIIGFRAYSFHPCLTNGLYICTAELAYVYKKYRRLGIYTNTLKEIERICKEKAIPAIRMYTHETNEPMKACLSNVATRTGFLQYQKSINLIQP